MKKIVFTLLAVLVSLTGCNAKNDKTNMANGKSVVVFFSHAGVQKGFSIYGYEVRSNKAKVEKWLNER